MVPTSFVVSPGLGTLLCCCASTELGTLDAFFLLFFFFFQVPGRPLLSSIGLAIPSTYFCPWSQVMYFELIVV